MRASSGLYLSRLDHLRFFAALLVFVWHFVHLNNFVPTSYVPSFPLLSIFEEGHTGVSLFLVLSGFIFMTLTKNHSIDSYLFYRNRIYRVFPLFTFWCMFYVLTTNIDVVQFVISTISLINKGAIPGVGWTVIVEFQYYLLFPFMLIFYHKYGYKYFLGILALSVMMKFMYWNMNGSVQNLSYLTLFGRIDQFILGMLAAHSYEAVAKFRARASAAILIASLLALTATYHYFNLLGGYYDMPKHPSENILWVFLPAIEGLLYAGILLGYLTLPIKLPRFLDEVLASMGKVSYSMYWSHVFVMNYCLIWIKAFGINITTFHKALFVGVVFVLPICLAFSYVTYYVIELPFFSLRKRYLLPLGAVPSGEKQAPA